MGNVSEEQASGLEAHVFISHVPGAGIIDWNLLCVNGDFCILHVFFLCDSVSKPDLDLGTIPVVVNDATDCYASSDNVGWGIPGFAWNNLTQGSKG